MQALEPTAGDELERMLARYARVRLDPSAAQTRRARAAVTKEAWRRHFVGGALPNPSMASAGGPTRLPFSAWGQRRIGVSLAAAVLAGLLVGSTSFAASRAGGPLYEARLNVETMLLPSQPEARLNAELAQAQARLADIVDAAGRGDAGAVSAAISAYDRSIQELGSPAGASSGRALQAVEFHQTVLEHLLTSATGPSVKGLENALTHSSNVIDRLSGGSNAGGNGNGGSNAGGNGTSAGGNGNGGSNAGGNGTSAGGNGNGGSNAGGNGNGGSNAGGNGSGGSNAGGNGNGGSNAGGNGGVTGPAATPDPGKPGTDKPQPTPKGPGTTPNPPGH